MTQPYGCTGFEANPRRGSCSHFHDGLDISPSGGTRIGTVATGVVAYAGWNPWDTEGRAFIVVVGHADGYVSRYGHLIPNRRIARAGQVLYRGQTLGYMGSTGNSTGVHLHVEILRNGSTVDPMSLLPDRGHDKAKKDKKKGHKHKGKHKGRHKGKHKSRKDSNAKADRKHDAKRRGDRAKDKGDGRDESAEVVEPPTAAPSDAGLTLETCDPSVVGSPSEDEDALPTLSDLAERLQAPVEECLEPVPGSAEDSVVRRRDAALGPGHVRRPPGCLGRQLSGGPFRNGPRSCRARGSPIGRGRALVAFIPPARARESERSEGESGRAGRSPSRCLTATTTTSQWMMRAGDTAKQLVP